MLQNAFQSMIRKIYFSDKWTLLSNLSQPNFVSCTRKLLLLPSNQAVWNENQCIIYNILYQCYTSQTHAHLLLCLLTELLLLNALLLPHTALPAAVKLAVHRSGMILLQQLMLLLRVNKSSNASHTGASHTYMILIYIVTILIFENKRNYYIDFFKCF